MCIIHKMSALLRSVPVTDQFLDVHSSIVLTYCTAHRTVYTTTETQSFPHDCYGPFFSVYVDISPLADCYNVCRAFIVFLMWNQCFRETSTLSDIRICIDDHQLNYVSPFIIGPYHTTSFPSPLNKLKK